MDRIRSRPRTIRIRPRLETSLEPMAMLGSRLVLSARLVPAAAGRFAPSSVATAASSRRGKAPRFAYGSRPAWPRNSRSTSSRVHARASLRSGAPSPRRWWCPRSPWVRGDQACVRSSTAWPSCATRSAAPTRSTRPTRSRPCSPSRVHGLARTGSVDAALWQRLAGAYVPVPRFGVIGNRIEIDKSRQVLFEILDGRVNRIVHVYA